jgi:fucose permease
MLLANGLFGVGGLIGPLIVYVFETNSFTIIGFIFLSLIPAYYLLPSPELQNPALENKDNATAATMQRITPRKIEILLCITLFIYIGLECTFGGWISSYSILAGVSNK